MTAPTRRAAAAGLVLAGAGLLAACGGSHGPAFPAASAPPVRAALAGSVAHPVKIGLVVTGSSAPGQGADDLALAAGARVAAYRLALARPGAVTLVVADDHGTAAGSTAAVRTLLADGVAGIVYASEGDHLDSGVALAQHADTAVLLPYATDAPAGDGVWLTGPSTAQVVSVLGDELAARQLGDPLVLSTAPVAGLDTVTEHVTAKTLELGAGLRAQAAADAAQLNRPGGPDAVVVWGPAAAEADAVAAVQESGADVPVLLGPDALSPAFPSELTTLGQQGAATTAGQYITAGVPATDNSTTAGMTAFLQAVRLASADSAVPALISDSSLSADGAATADSRAHDAVLALVDAVTVARSDSPSAVLTTLSTLRVPTSVGLAGPPLDFRSQDAVAGSGVVALQATATGSGQRTGATEATPALTWFSLDPTGG